MRQTHCSLKEVDTRQCTSKDAGLRRGWIWWQSHIDWRKERVPARMMVVKEDGFPFLAVVLILPAAERRTSKSGLYFIVLKIQFPN
ncbi:hypothetical protein SDJN02_22259, partial [Cucurbita argyrosperma subsp. argyrosperma]